MSRRHRDSHGGLLRAIGALCVLALPVAALVSAAVSLPKTPSNLETHAEPVLVRAVQRDHSVETAVAFRLVADETPTVAAPAWGGIVGEVQLHVGDTLTSGDRVAVVGGLMYLAIHTSAPFTRSLMVGDKGFDVLSLQQTMTDLGTYSGPVDAVFSTSLATAVKTWHRSLGAVAPTAIFEPSDVIWLPSPSVVVDAVLLRVGELAPTFGQPIVTTEPNGYSVTALDPVTSEPLKDLPQGQHLIVAEVDLGPFSTSPTETQVQALLGAARRQQAADPTKSATGAAPEAMSDVTVGATLRTAKPIRDWQVPASAVLTDPVTGTDCIFVASASGYDVVPTAVIDGTVGQVFIDPAPSETADVLANPLDIIPGRTCQS